MILLKFRPGFASYLDELAEFGTRLFEGRIVPISRSAGSLTYPANFTLIGSMNPCPCGSHGDPEKECSCSPTMVTRYQKRISGPLMDRIDIHVQVPRVAFEKLSDDRAGEPSTIVRERVEEARSVQRERFTGTKLQTNTDIGPGEIQEYCPVDATGRGLLKAAMSQLHLSPRAYHRILKLARTIADLAGAAQIESPHLAEAIQYRPRSQV